MICLAAGPSSSRCGAGRVAKAIVKSKCSACHSWMYPKQCVLDEARHAYAAVWIWTRSCHQLVRNQSRHGLALSPARKFLES